MKIERFLHDNPDYCAVRIKDLDELERHKYVVDRNAILKAVDDEPELPGEMPPAMWSALLEALMEGDKETVEQMVRIAVRQTKEGIRGRIQQLCEVGRNEA